MMLLEALHTLLGHSGVLLLTLLLLYVSYWVQQRRHAHATFKRLGIPYVKPHFIYGSHDIMRGKDEPATIVLQKWMKEHGKVFGFFSGPRPQLVIADLDMVKEILIKDFHTFSNRPKMFIKSEPVNSTLVGLRDNRWKEVRALLAPTFSMSKMKLMAGVMNRKMDEFLKIIGEHVENNNPIEWYSTYQGLTLDIISECALAMKSSCQREQNNDPLLRAVRGYMKNAVNFAVNLAIYFSVFGKMLSLISNYLAFSGRMTQMIVDNLKKVIAIRRTDLKTKNIDVLQLMLEAAESVSTENSENSNSGSQHGSKRQDAQKKLLSDEEIIANAWVFLLGGFETTANALTYTTYLLAKNPEQQERLYQEIKATLDDDDSIISYDKVSEMSYLEQVFSESLRIFPPIVTFVIREAARDTVIKGVRIPKDMPIMVPVWSIHHDPEHWPDPEKFDPERFSSETKSTETRHPMSYIPFGAGPRNCIGMRFAQLESKLAIARLLAKYRLETCPETPDPLHFTIPTVAINPAEAVIIRAVPRH